MLEKIKSEFQLHFSEFYDGFIQLLPELVLSILVLFFFWAFSRLIQRFLKNRLSIVIKDPVLIGFFSKVIKYLSLLIGISVCLKILHLDAIIVGIFSGAGVLAIVLGFAFKDIGENFIAGMILALNRPFKKGDLIMLGTERGRVNRMTIRETQIKTADGKDIFIPNASILKGNLINYTIDGLLRFEIEISVEEGSDFQKIRDVTLKALSEVEGILEIPSPQVLLVSYGSSTYNVQFNFWIDLFDEKYTRMNIRSTAHYRVWEALSQSGISLPGDVMEVKTFNDKDFPLLQKTAKIN